MSTPEQQEERKKVSKPPRRQAERTTDGTSEADGESREACERFAVDPCADENPWICRGID